MLKIRKEGLDGGRSSARFEGFKDEDCMIGSTLDSVYIKYKIGDNRVCISQLSTVLSSGKEAKLMHRAYKVLLRPATGR